MAVSAESDDDAVAFVKAQYGNDCSAMWDLATVTEAEAAADMAGWSMRVQLLDTDGSELFDETVEASGLLTRIVLATGTLTLTPGLIADDVVRVDDVYYQFAADPTTGTPDGTVGTPYLVDVGGTDTVSLANLRKAINATGVGGTDYSVEIVAPHATVEATASDATTLSARALSTVTAAVANAIETVVTGNDGLAFGAATLAGGVDATDSVASLATLMVTALNATALNGAAWNNSNQELTVSSIADGIGDHVCNVYVLPPNAEETAEGVPGFVVSVTDAGAAAAAIVVTLETDSYVVPQLIELLGPAAE